MTLQRKVVVLSFLLVFVGTSCSRRQEATIEREAAQTNWAKTVRYHAEGVLLPKSVEEIQAIIAKEARVKPLGSRHSFSRIADTDGVQISLREFPRQITYNSATRTVKIRGQATYTQVARELVEHGATLENFASLPDVSVIGAVSTGTHGSGDGVKNLSSQVVGMKFVDGNGKVVELTQKENAEELKGLTVGLGAFGVIFEITLQTVEQFEVRQFVYERLPKKELYRNFDKVTGSAYSVSLFTLWTDPNVSEVWLKEKVSPENKSKTRPRNFFGATLATGHLHPVRSLTAEMVSNCTPQMGLPGPAYLRLPHFLPGKTPSVGSEYQSEFIISRDVAPEALAALSKVGERIDPALLISEVRTIKADNLYMSPMSGRDSVGIHFTWKNDAQAVEEAIQVVEQTLAPFNPRHHWGKKVMGFTAKEIEERYPSLGDFRALLMKYDPKGKFRNEELNRYIFARKL